MKNNGKQNTTDTSTGYNIITVKRLKKGNKGGNYGKQNKTVRDLHRANDNKNGV